MFELLLDTALCHQVWFGGDVYDAGLRCARCVIVCSTLQVHRGEFASMPMLEQWHGRHRHVAFFIGLYDKNRMCAFFVMQCL